MANRRAGGFRRWLRRGNGRVLLSLLLCFPLGLVLMWRGGCRWPKAVKGAVTAALALAVALILIPQTTPTPAGTGGVQLVGSEPGVEIYGPELPENVNMGNYENILYSAATSIPVATPNTEDGVYAANTGKYYHRQRCRYATGASHKYTLYEAYYSGYEPCPHCNPPVYGGE